MDNNETNKQHLDTREDKGNQSVSDDVIIEVIHAFKDIIIEFINRKYEKK